MEQIPLRCQMNFINNCNKNGKVASNINEKQLHFHSFDSICYLNDLLKTMIHVRKVVVLPNGKRVGLVISESLASCGQTR